MKVRPRKPARDNASRLLPRLAEQLFEAGDGLARDLEAEQVHPFRIVTKRFRYALEYFRPCYGATMDSYLKAVKNLQQFLGEFTDCRASRALCEKVLGVKGNAARRHQKLWETLGDREQQFQAKIPGAWDVFLQGPRGRQKMLRYLAHPPRVRVGKSVKGKGRRSTS